MGEADFAQTRGVMNVGQEVFNRLVSVLRKKQLPITFSDKGKEDCIQLFNNRQIIAIEIMKSFFSLAQKPDNCESLDDQHPNTRLYKKENPFVRIVFQLQDSNIYIRGVSYKDKRTLCD